MQYLFFVLVSPIRAIEPFEPFSKEGNPDEEYIRDEIFPLFRYIKPGLLKVYENRDRSRRYENLMVCVNGDRRDQDCELDLATGELIDDCTGGDVDVCHQSDGTKAYTAHSSHGSCTAKRIASNTATSGTVRGKCEYKKTPKIASELKATDFSAENKLSPPEPPSTQESETPIAEPISGLVYPKLQNEACRYGCNGTDNPITWGTHRLALDQGEQAIKQVLVLTRAAQTKETLRTTGEWPLGWVDWGYKTANGKTLEEIRNEIPGGLAGAGRAIAESVDDFFLNADKISIVSDVSSQKEYVIRTVAQAASQKNPPEWVTDLLQVPLYSPSFRQGYARGSICVWDMCCPGPYCPFGALYLDGPSKAYYADISISQTFGAALDDLLLTYPLEEGAKIFNDLASGNQLIRFAGSASPNAVPSKIHARLSGEISDPCFKFVPGPEDFTIGWFGFYMDYADPPTYLDPNKKCPGWGIQPELEKNTGGALPQSLLASLINLVWGGNSVDDVDPVKYHLITIPDAMGQFISEIEDPVFQTRDTLSENEKSNEYISGISNIVDATTDQLYSGKGTPIGDAMRRTGLLACADPDYSSPYSSTIEAYAMGTRNGCFVGATKASACTGERFSQMIGDVNITPLPQAVSTITSSKLFVDGALNPDLAEAYTQVEEETGVPCEILAAHHFAEGFSRFFGSNNPAEYSAANGGYVGKSGFLESVRNAAKGVLRHPPTSFESMVTEMSYFNGGGNANCQQGFPVPIGWGGCPKQYDGDDDPYATNLLDSRHTNMFLLYCGDFLKCIPPKPYGDRPGAAATAVVIHSMIKNSAPQPSNAPSPTASPATGSTGSGTLKVDPAGTCGEGFIDTGLGCLPYEREAFVSALLSFLVGVAGLIALLTMMMATFQIMTAAGDMKKTAHGRELFTAGVTGLPFLIFSVTLLRIIAGDIIKLPGF